MKGSCQCSAVGRGVQTFRIRHPEHVFEVVADIGSDPTQFLDGRAAWTCRRCGQMFAWMSILCKDHEEIVVRAPSPDWQSWDCAALADIADGCRWRGSTSDERYVVSRGATPSPYALAGRAGGAKIGPHPHNWGCPLFVPAGMNQGHDPRGASHRPGFGCNAGQLLTSSTSTKLPNLGLRPSRRRSSQVATPKALAGRGDTSRTSFRRGGEARPYEGRFPMQCAPGVLVVRWMWCLTRPRKLVELKCQEPPRKSREP